jgi:predicted esterase
VDKAIAEGVPAERIIIGGFSQGGVVAGLYKLSSVDQ